jgi:hypothetical protein
MEPSRHGDCPFGGPHTVRLTADGRSVACPRCHATWTPDMNGRLIRVMSPTPEEQHSPVEREGVK